MKGKIYIYPVISFLMSLYVAGKTALNSEFEMYLTIILAILSPIIALVGFIKTIKYYGCNNKLLSWILLIINLFLIISGVLWALYYLTLGRLGAPPKHREVTDTIIDKYIELYRKVLSSFIK